MRFPRVRHRERVLSAMVAAAALVILLPGRGDAQFNGDPFDPFRASYRSSSLPTINTYAPGQRRSVTPPGLGNVPGIGLPFDGGGFNRTIEPPPGSRFDRFERDLLSPSNDVYRRYDEEFGRVYRPNAEADEQFDKLQEARRELYLAASREGDPQKRAELVKQYRDLSRRIGLGLSPTNSRNPDARSEDGLTRTRRQQQADAAADPNALPRTVRSFNDLERWSRAVNRRALAEGVVRPEAN